VEQVVLAVAPVARQVIAPAAVQVLVQAVAAVTPVAPVEVARARAVAQVGQAVEVLVVEEPQVPSDVRAVSRLEVVRASAPSVKSLTIWRRRLWAA